MEESQISLDVYRLISRSPWDDWMVLTEVSHEVLLQAWEEREPDCVLD
ncbi:hypothetical protein MPTK1_3g24620 [Marchantia polymorpha subsp. ruderalis]